MILLENNIPIPPVTKRQYRGGQGSTEFTTTLKTMNIGQSFVIQREKTSISSAISRLQKQYEHKEKVFITRKTGKFTYRIWRIC